MKHARLAGFTLMEILISIAILGVLVLMVTLNVTASQRKSRDLKRKSDLASIGKALEMYYNDFGKYPTSNNGVIQGCGADGITDCGWGGGFETTDVTYMVKLPTDPRGSQDYFYESSDGTYYRIYTNLENTTDPQYAPYQGDCTGQDNSCTWGLSSPNVTLAPAVAPGPGEPTNTPGTTWLPPTATPSPQAYPTSTPYPTTYLTPTWSYIPHPTYDPGLPFPPEQ